MTTNSRKAKYQYIFNQLLEAKSVEITVLNAMHLKRIRASLSLIKQQYDKTTEVLDLTKDIRSKGIGIVRKDQLDEFTYVISLVKRDETTFTIVGAKQQLAPVTQEIGHEQGQR